MKRYTDTHEWVEVNDAEATLGVSDFAQKELGEVVYVELPEVGRHIGAGEEIAVLESTKAAADVYSPISGEITAVNERLASNPELINQAAEQGGWLVKVKLDNSSEVEGLMDAEAYHQLILA